MEVVSKTLVCVSISILSAFAAYSVPKSYSSPVSYAHPKSYYESRVDLNESEQYRIRKHLAFVEADLRQNPQAGLTQKQLTARAQRLSDLHEYWVRGEFPKNPDYRDSLVPYFIDAKGVACAVGYLVIKSGHEEFAQEVARKMNHAYIREIKDPRLAEWAEQSGLTLEECARIQPSYGGPSPYPYIREIEVNSQGQIWTTAGYQGLAPMSWKTIYWNSGSWIQQSPFQYGQQCMCLDPLGRPLIGISSGSPAYGVIWNGQSISDQGSSSQYACQWSPDGTMAWVVNNAGMTEYRLNGSVLSLSRRLTPRESIFVVATNFAYVLGGSSRGLLRGLSGSPSLTRQDTVAMGSPRVTGLMAAAVGVNPNMVWAGVDGKFGYENPLSYMAYPPIFSGRGLLYGNGVTWTFYNRLNSGLPSDTIQAMTPIDSQTLWIASASGIYRFTRPSTVALVINPLGAPVTDMTTNTAGALFIATWGRGVYRFANDTLTPMGYLTVPIVFSAKKSIFGTTGALEFLSGRTADRLLSTLLGRKTGPKIAAGIYVNPKP